jgi:uncharacterized protein YbcC (UPF0753/DUF2309 family)
MNVALIFRYAECGLLQLTGVAGFVKYKSASADDIIIESLV